MKYLFVGGPQDGKRIAIYGNMDRVRFPVLTESVTMTTRGMDIAYEAVEYYRTKLHASEAEFVVYAFSGLTISGVISRLIEGYSAGVEQMSKKG